MTRPLPFTSSPFNNSHS